MKIAVVGGGSVLWVPALVRDMILSPALADAEYALYDIDLPAAELTAAFLRKLAVEQGVNATVNAYDDSSCLDGANYVVITIATGGLRAMAQDIAIPEEYSIYHTVGDTSGPGGWARLVRNFDAVCAIGDDINRYCPDAFVLNYTNPMGTLTDVLSRVVDGPVVGLCHSLFENVELLARLYNLEEHQLHWTAGGINHFFWMTSITAGETDILADLKLRAIDRSLNQILAEGHLDLAGFGSNRAVATELLRVTGYLPYLGDRHTCEFLPYLITQPKRMDEYKLVRTTMEQRDSRYRFYRQRLHEMIDGEILPAFRERTRETAADIIAAHATDKPFIDVGNVRNVGQIDNLPRGLVVETPVRVDGKGVTPLSFGSLPAMPHAMIAPYAQLYPMVVDACFKGDFRLALEALRLDPVCSHLTWPQVQELGARLLGAHQAHITAFKHRDERPRMSVSI